MRKSVQSLHVIGIFKKSFSNFPLDKLRKISSEQYLLTEARIALRELIEERENSFYL